MTAKTILLLLKKDTIVGDEIEIDIQKASLCSLIVNRNPGRVDDAHLCLYS